MSDLVLYHGTDAKNVPAIKSQGLVPPPGAMMPASWFMLTTSYDQAARYTSGQPNPVVLEYHLPEEKVYASGRSDTVLWPGQPHTAYDFDAVAYAIKGMLPSTYLTQVHQVGAKTAGASREYPHAPEPQAGVLYHGTSERAWRQIQQHGIQGTNDRVWLSSLGEKAAEYALAHPDPVLLRVRGLSGAQESDINEGVQTYQGVVSPGHVERVPDQEWRDWARDRDPLWFLPSHKTAVETYMMSHRPTKGPPAYDLLAPDEEQGEPLFDESMYVHPEYYCGERQLLPETMRTLRSARGNPGAQITIYRAQKPGAGLNTGDWVTLSKGYAQMDYESEKDGPGGKRGVETYQVPASTVHFAGDDLMEWGYFGPPIRGKVTSKTASEILTWSQVKARYPLYDDDFKWGISEQAAGAPDWDGTPVADSLTYTVEEVPISQIRFTHYDLDDSRAKGAHDGYQSGQAIPPVLLVRRADQVMTVDGNHRISAQKKLGRSTVLAIVAHSLRSDRYTGRGATGTVGAKVAEMQTFYHVTTYANWPAIRDGGLLPGHDGHVWLFTDSDAAMLFKDSFGTEWRDNVPPEEWRVPPCIVVVRTARAVPTQAGIPGAYWVEGPVTKAEVYDVIRPGDLRHYAKTAAVNEDLLSRLTYTISSRRDWDNERLEPGVALVYAMDGNKFAGALHWDYLAEPATVTNVVVEPPYRRQGLASRLWEMAKTEESKLVHSDSLTSDGRAWSQTTSSVAPWRLAVQGDPFSGRNMTWEARAANGELAGYIRFDGSGDRVRIKAVEVNPAYARQGVATWLLAKMLDEWDLEDIDPGSFTEQGAAWWTRATGQPASPSTEMTLPNTRDWRLARMTTANIAKAAKTGEDYSDYAMIALKPSDATRKVLSGMSECTEDEDELHLTLLYLGTKAEAGGDIGRELIYRALYDFSIHSGYRGLSGQANGFGVFDNPGEKVLVTLWDIPGIAEFRTHVVQRLKDHGVQLRQENHGFTPHMTLAYSSEPLTTIPRVPADLGEEIFTSLWFVWGGEWQEIVLP